MVFTLDERLKLAVMDPELAEFLKTANIPQLDYSDPAKVIVGLRAYMSRQNQPPSPQSNVAERDVFYLARDGFQLRARVYEPAAKSAAFRPLVVYIHGGGWTIGSPEDTQRSCRQIVENIGAICIAPSYRLGPEYPFPAGINDTWDGVRWIAANAKSEIGATLSQGFIIGGSSAGGNMASVISHLARDDCLTPAITGLFLLAPLILPPETSIVLPEKYNEVYLSRTQEECRHDPILNPALEKIFHDSAQGDPQSPLFVPFIWPTGHKGLPKTYFQVCGMDMLRDENLIYEQVLREDNGVETRLDVYSGMPHIFWGPFAMLSQGKKAAEDFEAGIRWLLSER